MITIDDIRFEYVKAYGDSPAHPIEMAMGDVEVRYTVHQIDNKVDGKVSIHADTYKQMKYDDIIEYIRQSFNETVEVE